MGRSRPTRKAATTAKKRLVESMELCSSSEDSDSDVAPDEFQWGDSGFKVARDKTRKAHYQHDSFIFQGETFEAEDCVKLRNPGGGFRYAKIVTMFREMNGTEKIEVKWFCRSNDIKKNKWTKRKLKKKEMILEESVNFHAKEITSCLMEKIFVLPSQKDLKGSKTTKKKTFFCAYQYTTEIQKYELIQKDSNCNSDMSDSDEETNKRSRKRRKTVKDKKKKLSVKEIYHHAFEQLQLYVVPDKLPCREKEHREIYDFIRGSIQKGGTGSGLYISGMPGTGKTATLRQIKRELKGQADKGKLNPFRFVEINAMKLPTPNHAFTEIYRALTGKTASPRTANMRLEKLLTEPGDGTNKTVTVIMLDELDYLLTRNENVIYTLFEWPSRRHARIVCVGIANTMDLIEQLTPRVQSRLGLKRIKFSPYKREDIDIIVKERLRNLREVFDPEAVKFCAAKVASVSGDVRRALQICRRASKICEAQVLQMKPIPKKPRKVGVVEINLACKSLFSSSDMRFLSNLAVYPKYFIVSLAQYTCANKLELAPVEEVFRRMNSFMNCRNYKAVSYHECQEILELLAAQRLIVKQYKAPERIFEIRLNVQVEDVAHALQADEDVSTILNTLHF